MSDSADRVLSALQKNPKLMWEVAKRLLILAPWEPGRSVGHPAMYRVDPWGRQRASVSSARLRDGRHGWMLVYQTMTQHTESADLAADGTDAAAMQAILAEADEVLRTAGHVLLGEDHGIL